MLFVGDRWCGEGENQEFIALWARCDSGCLEDIFYVTD